MSEPTNKFASGRIFIIAEMANAHEGDDAAARAIVETVAETGADAVKFQFFTADELAVPSYQHYPLYQKLPLPEEAWRRLIDDGHRRGLEVFADVFGLASARMAVRLGVDGFKIHNADVSNTPLLQMVGAVGKPMLLSCGGSTWLETAEAVESLKSAGAREIVLMHGFQSYPTKLEDSHLRRIATLKIKFGLPVGFAGHVDGGSVEAELLPVWATAAGADAVEVHITLDRSKQGLDYFSSLDPEPFGWMVRAVRALEPAMGASALTMPPDEQVYRAKHKKWLTAARDIAMGEEITSDNAALKRMDDPLQNGMMMLDQVMGRQAATPLTKYSPITHQDVKMKVVTTLACRAESSRLYGKPLQLIGGKPILSHQIDQLRRVEMIDAIVLAISEGPSRHVFIDYADRNNLPYVVGPEKDVLGRLILAADSVRADIAVRTTTENPYIYWENLNDLIRRHIDAGNDLTVTEKLPLGSLVEVISVSALKRSHQFGEDRHRSELCSLFIAENPDVFKIERIAPPEELQRPDLRLTVDTPEDLIVVRKIWEALGQDGALIPLEAIVDYLTANPDLAKFNQGQNTLYIWK